MIFLNKKFLFALAILIGTIIGAGIFGIPYVIAQSGIIPGFFYFLILGLSVTFLHLFFGEIVLRTKEKHRFVGYSQKYLGKGGKILITISTILGLTGTLLAYLILGGEFLKIIFSPLLNLSSFYFSLIFWVILSYFIFRGLKLIAPTEILTNSAFFLIIFLVFCFLLPKINLQNFNLINFRHVFLPYGVILFALGGWVAIPEMGDILKSPKERKVFKKIIILTTVIVVILYLLFSLAVVGVSGKNTSPEAFSGLVPFLGPKIIFLGALFGVITLADSFLVICLYLKNTLIYDYRLPKTLSAIVSSGLPLILFLIGLRGFIEVIGFVGTILGVIEGVVITLIFKKIKKLGERKPEYSLKAPSILIYFLIFVFILGAVSQIFYYLK
ncbi:hypothetical protein KJA15_03760 [Patescibacteria group bacterium]|nr:hypothetical protein [Patescibacteria group bacterium]